MGGSRSANCRIILSQERDSHEREKRQSYGEERKSDERVGDGAMIFDDGQRVAGKNLGDHVYIGKHGADGGGKDHDASGLAGEESFANERASDAVGNGIH